MKVPGFKPTLASQAFLFAAFASWLVLPCPVCPAASVAELAGNSVVKIFVTSQGEDYRVPWQGSRPASGTGSGFIIHGRRILTNAHIVSDARYLRVQKDALPHRYPARVVFIAHDCDLAVLTVDDPDFFEGTCALRLSDESPNPNDEVAVFGYPMGGLRLSVTRGVVSRLDYSQYSHSGVDQHLVLQVDAAINPGNSGGPVTLGKAVVGLAFQGLAWAENIGYAIPGPVIRHFLEDIKDGVYHGYPELGAAFMDSRNPALRRRLGLPEDSTGVVLQHVDPFGSAKGLLTPGDVLLSIDGHAIANDGSITIEGDSVLFYELLERKQRGQSVVFTLWRDKAVVTQNVPLTNPDDPFIYRNLYGERARYIVIGGLVFSPLTRGCLNGISGDYGNANALQLRYFSQYAKMDGLFLGRDEFVVLTGRLPHPVNTYAAPFLNGVVEAVNEQPISRLRDLKATVEATTNAFLVVRFAGMDRTLVLKTDEARAAQAIIAEQYGVSAPEWMGTDE